MKEEPSSSTSGYAKLLDFSISRTFSKHEEMSAKGYCRLFRAERYGKWYVLKGLQPQHAANPLYMAMLEKEFDTAVKMDHPNIVHTLAVENDAVAGPCIVMEYIEGRTLGEFLKEKPSKALRSKVMRQLLDAMDYYHAKQIVHRDLKPSNILVTRNGDNVKLIDFGLADADDYALLKEPAYTEGYAAPEQKTEGAVVDCRTDLYAFGVLLKKVFPYRYRRIARRCMQADPTRRYRDAKAVIHAIRQADNLRWLIPAFCIVLAVLLGIFVLQGTSTKYADRELSDPGVTVDSDSLAVQQSYEEIQYISDSLLLLLRNGIDSGEIMSKEAAYQRQVKNYILMHLYTMQLIEQLPSSYRANWERIWYDYNDIVLQHDSIAVALIEQTSLPEVGNGELLDPTFLAENDSLNKAMAAIVKRLEREK